MAEQKTVLIVDDEPDAVEIASEVLTCIEGIKAITANDGDSGLAKARDEKPDLIVLDVQMPGKTGFDVFSELKQDDATKDILVVMLTGISDKTGIKFSGDDMGEYMGQSPDAYLEKPVDPEVLQKTVSDLLGL